MKLSVTQVVLIASLSPVLVLGILIEMRTSEMFAAKHGQWGGVAAIGLGAVVTGIGVARAGGAHGGMALLLVAAFAAQWFELAATAYITDRSLQLRDRARQLGDEIARLKERLRKAQQEYGEQSDNG